MLFERIAGSLLFTSGATLFFSRTAHRKASGKRPAFAYDAAAVATVILLVLGIIMLTGVPVLDFSTTNPAP